MREIVSTPDLTVEDCWRTIFKECGSFWFFNPNSHRVLECDISAQCYKHTWRLAELLRRLPWCVRLRELQDRGGCAWVRSHRAASVRDSGNNRICREEGTEVCYRCTVCICTCLRRSVTQRKRVHAPVCASVCVCVCVCVCACVCVN